MEYPFGHFGYAGLVVSPPKMLPTPRLLVRWECWIQHWGCASAAQQQPKHCSVISSPLGPNTKKKIIFISARTDTEKLNPYLLIFQYALTSREWWNSFHISCDGTEPLVFCHLPKSLMPVRENLILQPESLGCEVEGMNPESSSLGCSLQVYFVHLTVFCSEKYGSGLNPSVHRSFQLVAVVTPQKSSSFVCDFDTSAFLVCL